MNNGVIKAIRQGRDDGWPRGQSLEVQGGDVALGAAGDPVPAVAHAPRRVPAPQLCARHMPPVPEGVLEACKHHLILTWQHSTQQSVTEPRSFAARTSS